MSSDFATQGCRELHLGLCRQPLQHHDQHTFCMPPPDTCLPTMPCRLGRSWRTLPHMGNFSIRHPSRREVLHTTSCASCLAAILLGRCVSHPYPGCKKSIRVSIACVCVLQCAWNCYERCFSCGWLASWVSVFNNFLSQSHHAVWSGDRVSLCCSMARCAVHTASNNAALPFFGISGRACHHGRHNELLEAGIAAAVW